MAEAPAHLSDRPNPPFWAVPPHESADNPLVCSRRLRARMRSLREARGLTQAQLAAEMRWSPSKVLRGEGGITVISHSDLLALATVYHFSQDELEQLLRWAHAASNRTWWWSGIADALDSRVADLLAHESSALAIHEYHSILVPALLQSPSYHAIVAGHEARGENRLPLQGDDPQRHAEAISTLHTERRSVVEHGPARIRFALAESVLWTPPGENADALVEQLDLLVEICRTGRVELAIVPFNAGAHWGLKYSMIKMCGLPPVVPGTDELELVRCDYDRWGYPSLSTTPAWVEEGRTALAQIDTVSLDADRSAALIQIVRQHVANNVDYVDRWAR